MGCTLLALNFSSLQRGHFGIIIFFPISHHVQKPFVHIEEIVRQHWTNYGRNFYCRYDYEGVDKNNANAVMNHLISSFSTLPGTKFCGGKYEVFFFLD